MRRANPQKRSDRIHLVAVLVLVGSILGCAEPEWVSLAGCQRILGVGLEQTWTPIIESDTPEPTRIIEVTSSAPQVIEITSTAEQDFTIETLAAGDATITIRAYVSYESEGYREATFPITVTGDEEMIPSINNACYSDTDEHITGERPTQQEEPES